MKSATRAASRHAARSLFKGMYCSFCLNLSIGTRKQPSRISASMSRLPFRLRIAAVASVSGQRGITATFRGAPSLPEKMEVSFWCSRAFSSCRCLAWFRRSSFDRTCWCGVLRCPFSLESRPGLEHKRLPFQGGEPFRYNRQIVSAHTFCGISQLALGSMPRLERLVCDLGRGPVGVVMTPTHCARHLSVPAGFETVRKGSQFFSIRKKRKT